MDIAVRVHVDRYIVHSSIHITHKEPTTVVHKNRPILLTYPQNYLSTGWILSNEQEVIHNL